jgi:hypothetical protein
MSLWHSLLKGVVIEQGRYEMYVKGDIHQFKDKLKYAGGRWDPTNKCWVLNKSANIDFLTDKSEWVCCRFAQITSEADKTFKCHERCEKYQEIEKNKNRILDNVKKNKDMYLVKYELMVIYPDSQENESTEFCARFNSLKDAEMFIETKRPFDKTFHYKNGITITNINSQIIFNDKVVKKYGAETTSTKCECLDEDDWFYEF